MAGPKSLPQPPPSWRLAVILGVCGAVVCLVGAQPWSWEPAVAEAVARAAQRVPGASVPGGVFIGPWAQGWPFAELSVGLAWLAAVATGITVGALAMLAQALVPRERAAAIIVVALALMATPIRALGTAPGVSVWMVAAVCAHLAAVVVCRRWPAAGHARAVAVSWAVAAMLQPVLGLAGLPLVWVTLRAWRPTGPRLMWLAALLLVVPAFVMLGELPAVPPGLGHRALALFAALTGGAAAVAVAVGGLGLGFGALTGLRGAGVVVLGAVLQIAAVLLVDVDARAASALGVGLAAVGVAVIAGAVVRVVAGGATGRTRAVAAVVVAAPAVLVALFVGQPGGTAQAPRPGHAPLRLAHETLAVLPAGPGVFFAQDPAVAAALVATQASAGLRPDWQVWAVDPQLHGLRMAVATGHPIATDLPTLGGSSMTGAHPRGAAFVVSPVVEAPSSLSAGAPRERIAPSYDVASQRALARAAVARARVEAAAGRLASAARALRTPDRFDAGDRAILAATTPTIARPSLFGFVPRLAAHTDWPVWQAVFADDLRWVGDLEATPLEADAPAERRLHAHWRALLSAALPDPVAATGFGDTVDDATIEMLIETGRLALAEARARAAIARAPRGPMQLAVGMIVAERAGVHDPQPPAPEVRAALEEASQLLADAATSMPGAGPLVWRALVLGKLGDPTAARAALEAALAREPGRPDLIEALRAFEPVSPSP